MGVELGIRGEGLLAQDARDRGATVTLPGWLLLRDDINKIMQWQKDTLVR